MATPEDWRDLRSEFEKSAPLCDGRPPLHADYAPEGWEHPLDRSPIQNWILSGGQAGAGNRFRLLARSAAALLLSRSSGKMTDWLDFLRDSETGIATGPVISSERGNVWSLETRAPIPVREVHTSSIGDVCQASITACTLLATGALSVPEERRVSVQTASETSEDGDVDELDQRGLPGTEHANEGKVRRFLDHVQEKTGRRPRLADLWRVAGYGSKDTLTLFRRGRASRKAREAYQKVLQMPAGEFLKAADKKKPKPRR